MPQYIVYRENGEIKAVESTWEFKQFRELIESGCEILGDVAAKTPEDAINYVEQVLT